MGINKDFKLIFFTVVVLTVLSLIGSEATDSANISIMQKNFSVACSFGWRSGLGAILALIGTKATSKSKN